MIKWILVVLTTLFTAEVFAGDAYSQSRCDGIKKEREYIRSKMRQGYKAAEGERLKTRFTFLFKQLANHCDKPKKHKHNTQLSFKHNYGFPFHCASNNAFCLPLYSLHQTNSDVFIPFLRQRSGNL